jgi:hypothetical protein
MNLLSAVDEFQISVLEERKRASIRARWQAESESFTVAAMGPRSGLMLERGCQMPSLHCICERLELTVSRRHCCFFNVTSTGTTRISNWLGLET